jgi:hypothetical protein
MVYNLSLDKTTLMNSYGFPNLNSQGYKSHDQQLLSEQCPFLEADQIDQSTLRGKGSRNPGRNKTSQNLSLNARNSL